MNDMRSTCTLCAYGLHSVDGSTCESCPPGSHTHDPLGGRSPPTDGGADGCDSCVLIGDAHVSATACSASHVRMRRSRTATAQTVWTAVLSPAHHRGPTSGGMCEPCVAGKERRQPGVVCVCDTVSAGSDGTCAVCAGRSSRTREDDLCCVRGCRRLVDSVISTLRSGAECRPYGVPGVRSGLAGTGGVCGSVILARSLTAQQCHA